jgi:hypothetical protein
MGQPWEVVLLAELSNMPASENSQPEVMPRHSRVPTRTSPLCPSGLPTTDARPLEMWRLELVRLEQIPVPILRVSTPSSTRSGCGSRPRDPTATILAPRIRIPRITPPSRISRPQQGQDLSAPPRWPTPTSQHRRRIRGPLPCSPLRNGLPTRSRFQELPSSQPATRRRSPRAGRLHKPHRRPQRRPLPHRKRRVEPSPPPRR